MSRIFLGWDQPALPAAAAHLIEHYVDGPVADLRPATVVLPGRRALRRIIELLLDEAEARGATLIPPAITTVGQLPGRLVSSPLPLADEAVARRAWSRALRNVDREAVKRVFPHPPEGDSLTEWDEIARLLARLHQNLAGEGHRFTDVAKVCRSGVLFDDGDRWEALALVQGRYLELLEQAGLADRFEARMAALDSNVHRFTGDLWLVSIVELPAVTQRLVEASNAVVRTLIHAPAVLDDGTDATTLFDSFGLPSTDYWESARIPLTDRLLEVVERPVDQADAVIDALAGLDGSCPAEDVVLGVHAKSEVVPYLEQRLEARQVPARYAAGTMLLRSGPVRLLQAVADYLNDSSFHALAALLRHPAGGALAGPPGSASAGLEVIEMADRYFIDHLPFEVHGEMPPGRGKAADFPPWVRAIGEQGPLHEFGGRKPLSEWMPVVMDLLLEAYGGSELDRSKAADRRLLDTLSPIQSVAAALAALPTPLDEECTGSAAIRTLLLDLREETLPPEPDRHAVELLDWLEVPLDDAPVAILTGFNEGFLPESVSGDAFLPDALRTRLDLLDNRHRLARDAYRLTTVLHSKQFVRLVAGRRSAQGDPLRPSRLMFQIPEADMAARVLHFLDRGGGGSGGASLVSLGFQVGARSQFAAPPEPVIELAPEEVPTALAVTAFRSLLADPYRFVLERVYRLDTIDDTARELDPMGFGSLAHEVLHRFGMRSLESPPGVDLSDESEVAGTLVDLLREEVSKRFGPDVLPGVELQAEQLELRLRAFAGKQADWAAEGWKIVAVECQAAGDGVPFDVDGTPILLRGRIDRIDHNASTGEWAVLDYKTGDSVNEPDKAHRKGRGDDREWVDLQLPLYRWLVSGIVDEHGQPIVAPDAVERGSVQLGYISLPRKAEESEFMIADWAEQDFAGVEATAREAIRHLRKGRFEFDRSVTKVAWLWRDPLGPLLAVGWQSPDAEKAEVEP